MKQLGRGERISGQDQIILESAETLLNPAHPDRFDLDKLAGISGMDRKTILARFPFPELLALGVVVMLRESRLNVFHAAEPSVTRRPNGLALAASDWVPDPELLLHFSDHSLVKLYLLGEPALRSWFRLSGKVT